MIYFTNFNVEIGGPVSVEYSEWPLSSKCIINTNLVLIYPSHVEIDDRLAL